LEKGELLTQGQVLEREVGAALQRRTQGGQQGEHEGHAAIARTTAVRPSTLWMEFWQTTTVSAGCQWKAAGTISPTVQTSSVAQTGALPGAYLASQFAALAAQVNPQAQPSATNVGNVGPFVFAAPHSTTFPDMPTSDVTPLGGYEIPLNDQDFDLGTVHYGQFLEPLWKEYVQMFYAYDFTLSSPADPFQQSGSDTYFQTIAIDQVPASWAPILSPPTAPMIDGADAFTTKTLASATPVVSWSAPSLGTATRYQLTLAQQFGDLKAGDVAQLTAIVYAGTSFKVPGGILKSGEFYSATLAAETSPDRLDTPILARGLPFTSVGCDFGMLSPP
jgi:hypothetical protein